MGADAPTPIRTGAAAPAGAFVADPGSRFPETGPALPYPGEARMREPSRYPVFTGFSWFGCENPFMHVSVKNIVNL